MGFSRMVGKGCLLRATGSANLEQVGQVPETCMGLPAPCSGSRALSNWMDEAVTS